jgi:high-affinity nickel-transport protein
MRHALEPDHLVAVCTLVGPGDRMARRGAALGALWGVGHTVALLIVTGVLGALHARLPTGLARLFELAVSVMLVALGVRAVRRALRDRRTSGADSPRPPYRGLGWRPFVVGVVHGLAGSGALAVLTITALPNTSQRLLYTCVFGAGSVLGMSLLSTAASLPLSGGDRRQRVVRALAGVAGLLSTVGGLAWAIELVSSAFSG